MKLLEGDEEVQRMVYGKRPQLRDLVERVRREIEEIHGHDAPSVIASERYSLASRIALEASTQTTPKRGLAEWFDMATLHPISGYAFMLTVILTMFYGIFTMGEWISVYLEGAFGILKMVYDSLFQGALPSLFWEGVVEGVAAGVTIALPYIVPFYIALSVLEDSGYMARIAYLADSAMHRIGLHGKGFIPLVLGFGCNVPATLGCRIMETERERLICAFTATLIPCAARSVVIMGLVARYLGFGWAAALYLIDFALIFALGRIAFKVVPGEPLGLIMEMPPYRWPTLAVTAKKAWFKLKDFVYTAFPIMVLGNLTITLADRLGFLKNVQSLLTPITVSWLGLPSASGVLLIFGILRKELALILLASMLGTTDFSAILTPLQMFVFSFVTMVYIPCIATISVLIKEFGYKRAAIISLSEIGLAIFLGGILSRIMSLLGLG
ncbi:ferrous iron transporter B [Candidatus Bathyarchaeota archaeon]|nr:ferrous iron transporter B [Candidatus Bathyarchaeota archaeon]